VLLRIAGTMARSTTLKRKARAEADTPLPQPAAAAAAAGLDLGLLPGLVGYVLRRAQMAVFEDFLRSFAALDLRPAQFGVLVIVERNPGRNQSEIAAALGVKRPNFVALLDELERRGLVDRRSAASDRRSHALTLTRQGRALLRRALAVLAEHEARICAALAPGEREHLIDMLRKVAGAAGG
jgi:DNA-binding MarR family transcriptional regulator